MTGGFTQAYGFLSVGVAATATFILFPHVYVVTWSWVVLVSVGGYTPDTQGWAPWIWGGLVIWLLYGLCRAALLLIVSLISLLAVLRLFNRKRRD